MAKEINGINSIEPLCTRKAAIEQAKQGETKIEENTSIFDKDTGMPKSLIEIAQNPVKNSEVEKSELPKEEQNDGKPHYFKHFMYGFLNQFDKLHNNIIEHPVKSALILGGTTLGILALPLIGIPSTIGIATLAIIYAITSLIKTGINLSKFMKHKKENNLEATQKDMENLGENSFDLAFSLPFVPKGIKDINRFAKYGKIGINYGLIDNISNAEGIWNKCKAFLGGRFLNSDLQAIELMKKNLPPEQVEKILPLLKLDNRTFAQKIYEILKEDAPCYNEYGSKATFAIKKCRKIEAGHYSHSNKEIVINSRYIDSESKADIVSTLAHELHHYKQDVLMDKNKLYMDRLFDMHHIEPYSNMSKEELTANFDTLYKRLFSWKSSYYPAKPTPYIKKLIDAKENYIDPKENYKGYWHNFLETDARKAQIPTLPIKTEKDAFLKVSNYNYSDIDIFSTIADFCQYNILADFITRKN